MFSTVLSVLALAIGITTVLLAARNRARGAELDSKERWCEIFSRQNEALRAERDAEEWLLLSGGEPGADDDLSYAQLDLEAAR